MFSLLMVVSICASGLPAGAQQIAADRERTDAILLPKRRTPAAAAVPLAELPAGSDQIVPQTLEIISRPHGVEGSARTLRQTITRTTDRIHISGGGREWLLMRNVRDPRRVSGTLVDHAARAVICYDESDLRNMLGLSGWADALLLGYDRNALIEQPPTPSTRKYS